MRRTTRLASALVLAATALRPAPAHADPMPSLGALSVGAFFAGPATITRFYSCAVSTIPNVCMAARVEQGVERATGLRALRAALWITHGASLQYDCAEGCYFYNPTLTGQWALIRRDNSELLPFTRSTGVLRVGDLLPTDGLYSSYEPTPVPADVGTFAVGDVAYQYTFKIGNGPPGSPFDFVQDDGGSLNVTPLVTTTPEPATLALVGGGLLAFGGMARRRPRS